MEKMSKIEKISKIIGYKYIRHGLPYRWLCYKNKEKINHLKSLLQDELSVKVIDLNIKAKKLRDYKCLGEIFDVSKEIQYTDILGVTIRRDPEHYFVKDIVKLSTEEVFVDAGGYIGDTVLEFVNKTKGDFKKVHMFEASKRTCEKAVENLEAHKIDMQKICIHNVGLFSSKQEAFFDWNAGGSQISKKGQEKVQLVKFDDYLSEEDRKEVTFVKMDIEGAEMDALKGMAETISTYKPKLAISIYHLDTDLWEIPLYIHQLNPDYKFYIRQHATVGETVCYAL